MRIFHCLIPGPVQTFQECDLRFFATNITTRPHDVALISHRHHFALYLFFIHVVNFCTFSFFFVFVEFFNCNSLIYLAFWEEYLTISLVHTQAIVIYNIAYAPKDKISFLFFLPTCYAMHPNHNSI